MTMEQKVGVGETAKNTVVWFDWIMNWIQNMKQVFGF